MTTETVEPEVTYPTHYPADQQLAYYRAAALAESKIFNSYMVYEKEGECWFGGGTIRSLTVFNDRLEVYEGGNVTVKALHGRDLCLAIATELQSWSGRWQVCGWACFEFAQALQSPELLTESEKAGQTPLMFLSQPELSVSLNAETFMMETTDVALQKQVSDVLSQVPDYSNFSSAGVTISGSEDYKHAVIESVSAINSGELDKVILSRKLPLDFTPDFVSTWLYGRQNNDPSRSFLLNLGGWETVGFSPEIVLSVDERGQVTTEPLAGTRRRDGLPEEDLTRFNELYSDAKETHEHAISVRLSFNEMAAVCEPSTISVRQFMERKERGSVQHLASTVCGELRQDKTPWDAFAALFPSVTASGIPKTAAFTEIRKRELSSRGIYAGAILRLDHSGAMDAALVLRSMYGKDGAYWLQAGAGIVGESIAERELTETVEKLSSIAPWVVKKK